MARRAAQEELHCASIHASLQTSRLDRSQTPGRTGEAAAARDVVDAGILTGFGHELRPEDRLTVWLEVSVVRDDDKAFDSCLRNQHAIERIGVMRRQKFGRGGVIKTNWQLDESALLNAVRKRSRQPHPAQC